MAKLIKADGTIQEGVDISTLRKQQELVGGYIEYAYGNGKVFIVNEEGLLEHLPFNPEASQEYGHPLVGDVVVCESNEIE